MLYLHVFCSLNFSTWWKQHFYNSSHCKIVQWLKKVINLDFSFFVILSLGIFRFLDVNLAPLSSWVIEINLKETPMVECILCQPCKSSVLWVSKLLNVFIDTLLNGMIIYVVSISASVWSFPFLHSHLLLVSFYKLLVYRYVVE